MKNTTEISVPLNRLKISAANVRQTAADPDSDAELKASLASVGLLQNLVVHKDEENEGWYEVDAGRRRTTLMQELAAEGVFSEEYPVHCLLMEDASHAVEVSLIENAMREDMHPADQVEAFAKLVHEGSTASEIAVLFGMSERAVEQRLRLGNVSPMLLQAYREGETSLDTLKAFSLTSDQKLQEEIWNNMHETRSYVSDYNVRAVLLEDNIKGSSRVAEFVGVEEYEKAGGRVTRDLFAEEDNRGIWLEDPQILYDLADRKLAAIAEELKDSWKWVEFEIEFGYEQEGKFNKVFPVKGKLTADEKAEEGRLQARRHELLQGESSEETRAEYNSVIDRMEELRKLKVSRDAYTDDQLEIAGCVVTIDYAGKAKVIEGLVRPGDMPKGRSKSSVSVTYRDPEKAVREKAGYSKKLMDEMRIERTKIVRSHLSGAFAGAFDLLLFQMARDVFSVERYFSHSLDVELFRFGGSNGATASIDVDKLPLDWTKETDDGAAFEKMRKLSKKKKEALFAACVAATYKGQLTIDTGLSPEVEAVVDDLSIDFTKDFRPTVENFWGRLTKGRMLELAEETLGVEWTDAHSDNKKVALAAAMERAFAAGDEVPEGVTPEGRAAALAWTPDGFVAE
ncbi:MAG: ParB N-terminal domain-containing protein [Chloroflexi bacterium]|nr:ParB N-terminal domain-containing protein [Chloroflexota bacterium]